MCFKENEVDMEMAVAEKNLIECRRCLLSALFVRSLNGYVAWYTWLDDNRPKIELKQHADTGRVHIEEHL